MERKSDPKRPIEPATTLKPVSECEHPWSRIALVPYGEYLTLECFDCGEFMKINGAIIVIK